MVLDFWTSFCQPCLAMVPHVRELMDVLSDEPVTYVGVCGDVDRLAGLATAQRVGMTWTNLWDGPAGTNGPAASAWCVPALGWPSVFVLDEQGRIRIKLRGKKQVDAELEAAVRSLLAELEAAVRSLLAERLAAPGDQPAVRAEPLTPPHPHPTAPSPRR